MQKSKPVKFSALTYPIPFSYHEHLHPAMHHRGWGGTFLTMTTTLIVFFTLLQYIPDSFGDELGHLPGMSYIVGDWR